MGRLSAVILIFEDTPQPLLLSTSKQGQLKVFQHLRPNAPLPPPPLGKLHKGLRSLSCWAEAGRKDILSRCPLLAWWQGFATPHHAAMGERYPLTARQLGFVLAAKQGDGMPPFSATLQEGRRSAERGLSAPTRRGEWWQSWGMEWGCCFPLGGAA